MSEERNTQTPEILESFGRSENLRYYNGMKSLDLNVQIKTSQKGGVNQGYGH